MSVKRIAKAIANFDRFLISSHIDLEGDALGSELALASLLRKLGKTVYIVNASRTPANYQFLPGVKSVVQSLSPQQRPQAAFIIDCSIKQRIGAVEKLIDQRLPIINIDHHIDNNSFGRFNWIQPQASSTGEMIYQLFKLMRVKLDKADALNIYTAMLTDTGCFRHSNTTSLSHQICYELLGLGIKPAVVYTLIYENNSINDVKLVLKIISGMNFTANNKIAWVKVPQHHYRKIKGRTEILDKIFDFARAINTVKVVLIISQKGNRLVKLSLRSKSPVNVQKVARSFGGGGHKFASGCTVKGSLKGVEKLALTRIKKALNGRHSNR